MLLLKGPDQGSIFRVNMQRAQWESEIVACFCGVNEGLLRCSKCKIVAYVCLLSQCRFLELNV